MGVLRKFSTLLILLLLVPFAAFTQGEKKYDKYVIKAEADYKIGNYAKAIKSNEKLGKKAIKKMGPESYYAGVYYLNRAKYNLAVGLLIQFENDIQKSLEIGEKIGEKLKEADPTNYVTQLLNATELFIQFGNYRKASEYLTTAQQELTDSDKLTESLKARIDVYQSRTQTGMGYYNKALQFIAETENYLDANSAIIKLHLGCLVALSGELLWLLRMGA